MRLFVAISVALALALAPAAAQPNLKKIRVTQAVASFTFLPADYARAKGYFVMSGLVVAPKTLAEDPETVQRIVRALRKAMDDIRTKPTAEIADAIKAIYEKVDPETFSAAIDATKKAINPTGRVTKQMWVNTLKLDGRDVDPDKLVATFDDRFLK